MNADRTYTLEQLQKGDRARLMSFGASELAYRQKLIGLGLTQGVDIIVMHRAPLGCPIEIKVRNVSLALRLNEARALLWERL